MSRRKTATENHQDQQQRILSHLETLGVSLTDEQLGRVLREAEQGGWSHLQLLDRLFAEPAARKRERSVAHRIRDAHFPENKTLESFDWAFNAQAIDRVQMEELATGEFIRRADNLLMVGQSGIGKSHLLEGIGRRACALGYRVRYVASDELLADLGASLADGTTPKRIRYYTRFDLLIIDGFGFDRIERQESPQALSLLYKVIDKRNPRRSTALITNIPFDAWNEYLGDPPMVMALLDRLLDRAIRLNIVNAKSYRVHRSRCLSSGKSQSTNGPSHPKKPQRKSKNN
ncbi:MAG: ATP-binding protein [Pirellulaceae bacterium]|jgi:DNA replication protein DnaC|nr:ATP-binding protein [Pirellulaceae bacterium]MCU0979711.1 ATP-binding protein [Pirellulaceae bacterium]